MSYFKRFLIFALSALLILAPPMAYATTSTGGWTAVDTITAGATNTINAVKGAGATGMRSAVTVGASASKVGKHLIKGGGQAAIAYAMVELADGALDWILDPANNRVKIKVDASGGVAPPGTYKIGTVYLTNNGCATAGYTPAGSCFAAARAFGFSTTFEDPATCKGGGARYDVSLNNKVCVIAPPAGGGTVPDEYRYIPIGNVAAKVIANAEAGHAPSQEAVKATALEGFAAGEHDAALDAAAVPDTGVENPPDTDNPPKDPDAPAEPFDPAGIISAINALKAMLAGILSSITSLSDFMQAQPDAEPDPKDTAVIVDAPIDDFDTDKSYITFAGSCPPNYTASMSIMGNTVPFSFDYAPICTVMSALKPFIVGAGYLTAAYIIAGHSRGSRD